MCVKTRFVAEQLALVLRPAVVVLSIWLAFRLDPREMAIIGRARGRLLLLCSSSLIAYMLDDEVASVDKLFARCGNVRGFLASAFAYLHGLARLSSRVGSAPSRLGNPRTSMNSSS